MRAALISVFILVAAHTNIAAAEVVAAGPEGFSLKVVTTSTARPEQAYQAFAAISQWWDPAHSYSGDATTLSLQFQVGGGFLERLPKGGFVEHLRVVYVSPGKEIRLLGGLGPLQAMGLHGAMTVQFKPLAAGCEINMLYNVSGFTAQGLVELASVVDRVQQGQMERHASYSNSLHQGH